MQHLVVVAHPVEGSFTMGARAYASKLEQLGHAKRICDLYRMPFNPVLPANELMPVDIDHPSRADLLQAQRNLTAADVLTVIYPLWWLSMPAIMKGYIDRVFARGFTYESHNGVVRGLLSGKQCVLIAVSGAPLSLLVQSGNWNAVQVLQDTHIFRSAGFELLELLHFDEVVPYISASVAEQHMARVQSRAEKYFPAA